MNQNVNELTAEMFEELLSTTLHTGFSYKELYDVSDDTMENIYAHAYKYYQQGRIDEAEKFFSFLCVYDLKNPDYLIGLGAVNQIKKNYIKACDLYALAHFIGVDNYSPVFFSGQCQLLMGNIVKALQCFELVCQHSQQQGLINKAKVYLKTIRQSRNDLEDPCSDSNEKVENVHDNTQ